MNKREAEAFVKDLAQYGTQNDMASALGHTQSFISKRLKKAREILGTERVQKLLGRTAEVPAASIARAARALSKRAPTADELVQTLSEGDEEKLERSLLEEELRRLRKANKSLAEQVLTSEQIRRDIFEIAHSKPTVPEWVKTIGRAGTKVQPGVPILFASDWHWGEVVKPSEIGGVNEYNLPIARGRCQQLIETTINLLTKHMVNPVYPGIIFALGGDMVSGNIHDELAETNEEPIMPVVLDIIDHLIAAIKRLKQVFKRVCLPCVPGNHSRIHQKIRAKEANYSSFDWLIYQSLDRHFQDDPDVVFYIPDGPDALVDVCGYKYLFTHGNQFRGGDGMIGPLGPVTRGDHKKRSRNAQIDQEYDTLCIGHFHQLLQTRRVIMNGSLIGYNEYAHNNNFGFEQPQQALWITHPERGITFSMPVQLGEPKGATDKPWVSFFEAKKAA